MPDLLKIHKALADETRLRLVRLLERGPLNVNEIIEILQMGQSRISRHLRILAEAGLVRFRREGTWIYYQGNGDLADSLVSGAIELVRRHERTIPWYEEDLQGLERVVEQRREQTRIFFDGLTDPEELHPCLDGAFYRPVVLSLLPEKCRIALDMGTGAGLLLPDLLERAERVIAVDASTTMLERARRAVAGEVERCDFRLGDLSHLPVANGEVDVAVACMVLHHLPRPVEALADAWRVLAPRGYIAIVDLYRHDDETLRTRHADLWLGFAPEEVGGWLEDLDFELVRAEVLEGPGSFKLITFQGRKP